jgi:hypothetical protein
MPAYEAASEILMRPDVQARVEQWRNLHQPPPQHTAPNAAGWWLRYCHSVLTSMQRIDEGFWDAFYADTDWLALVHAGAQDPRPPVAAIQNMLRQHGVRRHRDKGAWIFRAWDELDVDAMASAGEQAIHEGATNRESELLLVDSLLHECGGMGVGPKVARLMMIWEPERATMGLPFRHVIPLDRRWINALESHGVLIEQNLSYEEQYRVVENEICAAAYDAGLAPFEADGAVFGWL